MAVPFEQLPAASKARILAVSGTIHTQPALLRAHTDTGGAPLGDVLRVQLSGAGSASAILWCRLEGSRRCGGLRPLLLACLHPHDGELIHVMVGMSIVRSPTLSEFVVRYADPEVWKAYSGFAQF